MIRAIFDNFIPAVCVVGMCVVIYAMVTTENEYKSRGELYQCFADGEQIYASNDRPQTLGGQWYMINERKFKADECFCMGCIGF